MTCVLSIEYEEERYDVLYESADQLTFSLILQMRPMCFCWLFDLESNCWIRISRIDVLKVLLKGNLAVHAHRLRFQLDPKSPNASQHVPLTKREKGEGETTTSSVAENTVEPFTQIKVSSICLDQIVVIEQNSVRLSVHSDSLLTKIRLDAEKGISPFSVLVGAELANGEWKEIVLSKEVWTRSLLRGNFNASAYLEYVLTGFANLCSLAEKLKELRNNSDLRLRLQCLHFDLQHFESAQPRLENYRSEYYLSKRYFSASERTYLLEFPTASGSSARQSLAAIFTANGEALREMCTSHDVASAIERIFGIRKGFEREKAFQQYFKAFAALETTF